MNVNAPPVAGQYITLKVASKNTICLIGQHVLLHATDIFQTMHLQLLSHDINLTLHTLS